MRDYRGSLRGQNKSSVLLCVQKDRFLLCTTSSFLFMNPFILKISITHILKVEIFIVRRGLVGRGCALLLLLRVCVTVKVYAFVKQRL